MPNHPQRIKKMGETRGFLCKIVAFGNVLCYEKHVSRTHGALSLTAELSCDPEEGWKERRPYSEHYVVGTRVFEMVLCMWYLVEFLSH